MKNLFFEGEIIPHKTSFLATAPIMPDGDAGNRKKYPGGWHGKNSTSRLPRVPQVIDGEVVYIPYFPGAGIRGALRRIANEVCMDLEGRQVSIEEHRIRTIGGVRQKGAESIIKLQGIVKNRQHPLLSLFGVNSPEWMEGRCAIGHAIPSQQVEPVIVAGVRKDDLVRGDGARFLTEEDAQNLERILNEERDKARKKQALLKEEEELASELKKVRKEGASQDRLSEIQVRLEEIRASLGTKKNKAKKPEKDDQDDSDDGVVSHVSVQQLLSGYEAFAPETSLGQNMALRNATLSEIGLFFSTLDEFAARGPFLGAHYHHGCGLVRGSWQVKGREGMGHDTVLLGTLNLVPYKGIEVEGDRLRLLCKEAHIAFLNAMETLRTTDQPKEAA